MQLERNAWQVACRLLLFDFGFHSSVQLGIIEGLGAKEDCDLIQLLKELHELLL